MLRKYIATTVLVVAMVFGCAMGAAAADEPDPGPTGNAGYTPRTGVVPTLAGSTAIAECLGDVPWIRYDVILTDPDHAATGDIARLIIEDGSHTSVIVLGRLVDGHLTGEVLWPGASTDAAGNPTGWPGWKLDHGHWAPTDGNRAWTRGAVHARLEVNPSIEVPLAYPSASSSCANPATIVPATHPKNPPAITPEDAPATPPAPAAEPAPATPDAPAAMAPAATTGILAVTGPAIPALPLGIAGGVIMIVGLALILARRLHRE